MTAQFTRKKPREITPRHLELEILLIKAHELEDWNMRNLQAPYWRFYLVDRPGGAISWNEGKSRLSLVPERFALIPPEFRYAAEQTAPFTQFYVHFLVRKNESWTMPDRPVDRACTPAMLEARDRLLSSGEMPHWPAQFLVRRLIYDALDALPAETFSASAPDGRISQACDLMKRRVREGINNDALASAVGMNTNAFIRLFRERTGLTPQKYLTRERIAQGCLLLHHSALSIEQIAERCGFCDRYHFTRVFQKHREMGPATFRRTLV